MGTAAWGGWQSRHLLLLCLLTAGPLFYFAAIHTIFLGSMRYRHPAEYPLCILSAIGIQCCFRDWQKKNTDIQKQHTQT
ncbi:hypothetical protein MNBD_PLANCTO02-2179 [hydrothermal vent metagenome]|uniref:Uncharacterized protein n=1 Tax=hydrothermal vent metagenome TaxID=652676 RepID=A0A3B1DEH8_9ZZZZ